MEGHECGRRGHDSRGVRGYRGMPGSRGVHLRRSLSEAPRTIARGGIRFAILDLLTERPRHGYDIIRGMEEASGGLYSPSPGAIYPTLQVLEDQELVTSSTEEGKKVYAITEAGAAYLREHSDKAASHREQWEARWGDRDQQGKAGDILADLHRSFHAIKHAVRDGAGDAGKLEQIVEVLKEATAKIEGIVER